jgi:hypothetical protein
MKAFLDASVFVLLMITGCGASEDDRPRTVAVEAVGDEGDEEKALGGSRVNQDNGRTRHKVISAAAEEAGLQVHGHE